MLQDMLPAANAPSTHCNRYCSRIRRWWFHCWRILWVRPIPHRGCRFRPHQPRSRRKPGILSWKEKPSRSANCWPFSTSAWCVMSKPRNAGSRQFRRWWPATRMCATGRRLSRGMSTARTAISPHPSCASWWWTRRRNSTCCRSRQADPLTPGRMKTLR